MFKQFTRCVVAIALTMSPLLPYSYAYAEPTKPSGGDKSFAQSGRVTSLITTDRPHWDKSNPGALTVEIQDGTLQDFVYALKTGKEKGVLAPITKEDPAEIYVYVKSRFVGLKEKRQRTAEVLAAYQKVYPDIKPRIVIASAAPRFEQVFQTMKDLDTRLQLLAESSPNDAVIQKVTADARKAIEPLGKIIEDSPVRTQEDFEDQPPLTTEPVSKRLRYGVGGIRAILIAATSVYASWSALNGGVDMGEAVGSVIALNSLLEFISVVYAQSIGRGYESLARSSLNVYRDKFYRWLSVALGTLLISSLGRTLLIQFSMWAVDPVHNREPGWRDGLEIALPSLPGLVAFTRYFSGYRNLQEKGQLSIAEADNMNAFVGLLDSVITILNTFKLYKWRYPVWFVQWGYYEYIARKAARTPPRHNRIVLVDGKVDDWESRIKSENRIRTWHVQPLESEIDRVLEQIKNSEPMAKAPKQNCKDFLTNAKAAIRGFFEPAPESKPEEGM